MVATSSNSEPVNDTEDLTDVVWNDTRWLSYFSLNENTALDYFSSSQFYDSRCNNELIRMQRLDPSLLKTMAGIEYSLSSNPSPGLFIITKSRRTINPPKLEPLATYYIHDGVVYQAPSLHAVLSSRILQTIDYVRKAFDTMNTAAVFGNNGKYSWEPPPIAQPKESMTDDAMDTEPDVDGDLEMKEKEKDHDNEINPAAVGLSTSAERAAVDRMLYDVLEKNRRIAAAQEEKRKAEMAKTEPQNENQTERT